MIRIVVALAGTAILCALDIARIRPVAVNFQDHAEREVPQTCPVTKPLMPPFVPPAPYPSDGHVCVWFGSPKLWTQIPKDGVWRNLPHYTPDDTRFRPRPVCSRAVAGADGRDASRAGHVAVGRFARPVGAVARLGDPHAGTVWRRGDAGRRRREWVVCPSGTCRCIGARHPDGCAGPER